MVAHEGFEPPVSGVKIQHPGPLDECAKLLRTVVRRPPSTVHRDAEGSRTPDWPGCSRSPLPLGYGITSLLVDLERLELSLSSLQARRFPSKLQAQAWFGKGELGTPKAPAWGPCTPTIYRVRGAGSNRRSPGSQSGALPLSYREHVGYGSVSRIRTPISRFRASRLTIRRTRNGGSRVKD